MRTINKFSDERNGGTWKPHLFLLTVLGVGLACTALAAEERERIGHAYDRASGALIYKERHTETYANGEMARDWVQYIDPQGQIFGHKRVDFSRDAFVPEYQLNNTRTGHAEGLTRLDADKLQVRFREHAQVALRQQPLSLPDGAIADAGFDRFIESRWNDLLDGQTLVRKFLVPSRLEFMDWRIRRDDELRPGARTDGSIEKQTVRFVLEIDSAFLRFVVPSIVVIYDRDTRRLLRYEGLSNLRDASGENLSVRIEFEYVESRAQITDPSTHAQRHRLASATSTVNPDATWQTRYPHHGVRNAGL